MKRVAILCGGPGSEHEISCLSAGGVLSAIDRDKYDPILIGITRDGKWMALPLDYPLSLENGALPSVSGNFPEMIRDKNAIKVSGAAIAINQPIQNGVQNGVGRQAVIIALILAQLGAGRLVDDR